MILDCAALINPGSPMPESDVPVPASDPAPERRDASPLRRPPGIGWESFAEYRIREAQAAGKFDNLPGLGRPIPGIDDPPDENWWVKRKLRDEELSIVPPVLHARRERERTLEAIGRLGDEAEVRQRLERLNEIIRQALLSPVAGPADGVALVDVEQELACWREARRGAHDGTSG